MRSSRPALACAALLAGLISFPGMAARRAATAGGSPWALMRNVHMVVMPGVILEVRELHGQLQPARRGGVPTFDDPRSFRIAIDRATTAISTASLAALLNGYTFAYPGAPLRGLAIEAKDGKLKQKGTLHKGVDLPFEMEGELSPRPDGRLRVHPTSIKVGGVPAKKLLDALGLELVKVIKVRADRGVSLDGDDLLLDPERLLPPPQINGKVRGVRLEGDRVVLELAGGGKGRPRELKPSLAEARNFMYFRGGRLRFGKLTMDDTDLQIVDADPADPFLFSLAQYARQLVAGYSKTMPDKGLVTFMPDADRTGRALSP
jgi:hypothetical protein